MKAHWAKADDAKGNASLAEAERKSSNKAISAQRHAELAKALYEVADAKRRLLRTPEQKATIDVGADKGARVAEQGDEDSGHADWEGRSLFDASRSPSGADKVRLDTSR